MIRFFDLLFTIIALIILIPLFLPIMIILLLTGEHHIFYIQKRVGKNGKTFGLLKFATMLANSSNIGSGDITIQNDPRVLPFGHFLRKSKINELPQLFNILFGQMSLVGPRPLTPNGFSNYTKDIQDVITKVTPGLTGMGSIFFRDEETIMAESDMSYEQCYHDIIAPYKGKLECWYYENRSILNYFKIIFTTVVVVLNSNNSTYKQWFKKLPEEPLAMK